MSDALQRYTVNDELVQAALSTLPALGETTDWRYMVVGGMGVQLYTRAHGTDELKALIRPTNDIDAAVYPVMTPEDFAESVLPYVTARMVEAGYEPRLGKSKTGHEIHLDDDMLFFHFSGIPQKKFERREESERKKFDEARTLPFSENGEVPVVRPEDILVAKNSRIRTSVKGSFGDKMRDDTRGVYHDMGNCDWTALSQRDLRQEHERLMDRREVIQELNDHDMMQEYYMQMVTYRPEKDCFDACLMANLMSTGMDFSEDHYRAQKEEADRLHG